MSDFKFACPHCGQHIAGDERYGGQQIRCPHCQRGIEVPLARASSPLARPARPRLAVTPTTAAGSQWPTLLFWSGFALVACLALGWTMHRRSAPRRSMDSLIGKGVVVLPPGAPDAHVLSPSASSAFAKIRIQNPPQAITFLLELKRTVEEFYDVGTQARKRAKTVEELYEERMPLHYGVARICFDTDDNVRTGERGPPDGPRGYELSLGATLVARGERMLADWANAHVNLGKAKGHALRCSLYRVQPEPGPYLVAVNQRNDMGRAKVDGKLLWITVTYGDLGVRPGQTVRITILDQGNEVYGDGEMLPSFPIQLQ
jgi:hypothetical protein